MELRDVQVPRFETGAPNQSHPGFIWPCTEEEEGSRLCPDKQPMSAS